MLILFKRGTRYNWQNTTHADQWFDTPIFE